MVKSSTKFEPVASLPDLPRLETDVLAYWKEKNVFQRSIQERPVEKSFTFYDGPPFATGLPHYGHILTSVLKDLIPRFKTMQGFRVERRWGWDCHGLPIENIIEKELGLKSKRDIEAFGIAKFNEACQTTVLKYAKEWETFITRIGRWVDFENDYRTMDREYMESVWWAFKELHGKDLVYEGYKVLWYCTRCATPLSNFEAGLDDAYRQRQDPSVTFKVRVEGDENLWLWLWTTTPWTIPSHMMVAVHPEIEYAVLKHAETGERAVLAVARVSAYEKELAGFVEERRIKGADLIGKRYAPPVPYFASKAAEGAFRVVPAAFVTDTDGTGLAHEAPAFGAEDFELAQAEHVPVVQPVDAEGLFTVEVPPYVGRHVHEAQADIIKDLKTAGLVVRHETYDHAYPHCWRCDTPLIQKAVSTWFVAVTKIRDKMVAHNKDIHWVPDRVKEGIFGNWLAGAKDWAVSRNRYWGAPIPVWRCDTCAVLRVFGSVAEVEEASGVKLEDIHKQFVDPLTFPCTAEGCSGGTMRRVSEVLDCWFESGSMPYAQQHYPFENKEVFARAFPGDFITEYVGQTRGWFYTMTVLATALFDKEPFKNVIVHGIVLAEDGRKMSKRLKNYPDPNELVSKYGADALRLYLMRSAVIKGDDLRFSERELVELMRRTVLTLWNTYGFFLTYAAADHFEPSPSSVPPTHVLDQWILSRLQGLISDVTEDLEAYDVQRSVRRLESFVEELSNWYVRRSRRRFWKTQDDADKRAAEQTLYDVLLTLSKLIAPVLPFLAETMYQGLTRGAAIDSVHLETWPAVDAALRGADAEEAMERTRQVVTLGHAARDVAKMKVRQPLAEVRVTGSAVPTAYSEIIRDELNVKLVSFDVAVSDLARQTYRLQTAKAGPLLRENLGTVKRAVEAGEISVSEEGYVAAGVTLPKDLISLSYESVSERFAIAGEGELVVGVDTQLTDALRLEGDARELIRAIQQARKDAGYDVSDRIILELSGDRVQELIDAHGRLVTDEVLASDVRIVPVFSAGFDAQGKSSGVGGEIGFSLKKG